MRHATTLLAATAALAFALPAGATTFAFGTPLSSATSSATGYASATFDDVTNKVSVDVTFAGLATPASAAHIHCCVAPPGTAGVQLGFTAFPNAVAGHYVALLSAFSGGGTFASVLAGTMAGNAYVNIHNATFPGGEIRGFLAPVPEPATFGLMLGGLALVGWSLKSRRQA